MSSTHVSLNAIIIVLIKHAVNSNGEYNDSEPANWSEMDNDCNIEKVGDIYSRRLDCANSPPNRLRGTWNGKK